MILYTLVHSYNENNLVKHKILGSTFESDTAIFLYFSNLNIKDNIYFVFTEIDFHLVKEHIRLDTTLEFFPDVADNKISNLNLYKKDSIFRLQANYISDIDICMSSIDNEALFTSIITKYESEKENLLPKGYEQQDNKVFSEEQDSEILYVAVLNYSINGKTNTVLAGCSYKANICAMLLQHKIEEVNADWCSFHFKTMFIYKSDINDFLNNQFINFNYSTEDPLINIMLSPIAINESLNEDYLECNYLDIADVNDEEFNYFIKEHWNHYKEYFLENGSKDIVVLEEETRINPEYFQEHFLIEKEDWKDGINLLNYIIEDENIAFSLFNNINYPSVYLENDNKLIALNYFKDCLTISHEVEVEDLSLLIFISQKTNFSLNNKTKHRLFGVTIDKNGIFPLNKEICKQLYIENHDGDITNLIFMNAEESLNVLNIKFDLKTNHKY